MEYQYVLRIVANTLGRDFVVGDIHGYFSTLQEKLIEIGFDESKDRLFSVGDLIDRGPDSLLVLEWLDKPWFFAVRGNHEQLLIDSHYGNRASYHCHFMHGGEWFYDLSPEDQTRYCQRLDTLPYVIEIDSKYAIIHGEPHGESWPEFISLLHNNDKYTARYNCLWGGNKLLLNNANEIRGITTLYCGHNRVVEPRLLGNVWFIETCVFKPAGYLTVMQIGNEIT